MLDWIVAIFHCLNPTVLGAVYPDVFWVEALLCSLPEVGIMQWEIMTWLVTKNTPQCSPNSLPVRPQALVLSTVHILLTPCNVIRGLDMSKWTQHFNHTSQPLHTSWSTHAYIRDISLYCTVQAWWICELVRFLVQLEYSPDDKSFVVQKSQNNSPFLVEHNNGYSRPLRCTQGLVCMRNGRYAVVQ